MVTIKPDQQNTKVCLPRITTNSSAENKSITDTKRDATQFSLTLSQYFKSLRGQAGLMTF